MISAYVEGAGEVIAKLDRLSDRMAEELKIAISSMTIQLQKDVKEDFLSGQALNVKTGRLKRSIHQDVQASGSTISGVVSTNVVYAAVHEFGFNKTVQVKDYQRWQTVAWGKPMDPKQVTVKAHSMKMNIPQRPFLVPALKAFEASGKIREGIDAAIAKATE